MTRWARRHRRVRLLRRRLFYVSVRGLACLARHTPRSVAYASLEGLAWLAWRAVPRERGVALRQIRWAFPELDPRGRQRLARRSYRLMARNLVDAVRGDRPVIVSDADAARLNGRAAGPRPLLVLMAHLGCWELVGRYLARLPHPFGVVTANPHNDHVDAWLRRERGALGLTSFDRRRELRRAARWLKRGNTLVMLGDHRGGDDPVWAPWFGRPAPTPPGPARLARWSGAHILPVGIRREGDGHRLLVGEEVPWSAEEEESLVVARCNGALEGLIRQAPAEWTWFHDRYGSEGMGHEEHVRGNPTLRS